MAKPNPGSDAQHLKLGERVSRKDGAESGTVTHANDRIKVTWDSGRTSYFRRDQEANVRTSDPKK